MVSDSEGDDFEDATEFGVDDGELFGMISSGSKKSPMSKLVLLLISNIYHCSSTIYCCCFNLFSYFRENKYA